MATLRDIDAGEEATSPPAMGEFHVHLENFSGPFDLLLSLIAKHKLDLTEVALATVTDEFIGYLRAARATGEGDELIGGDARKNLGLASEFLVVAATLLDLKAARLLPTHADDDEDAIALLEARDLLFAKLLQYRAYKQLANVFDERLDLQQQHVPRSVSLEPHFAALLPELVWTTSADALRTIALRALDPATKIVERPVVSVDHLHTSAVTLDTETPLVLAILRKTGTAQFTELIAGVADRLTVVVRFLVLLELFRNGLISVSQESAAHSVVVTLLAPGTQDVSETSIEMDTYGA
ncbi:segregation and condensation protein A [Jonesia quinghaiensis]|uniref:segregation and condensation protein A n=1 Tax=Jonesia quinghaiensis TaxID=262806 RepID=UPI001FDFEFCB|nr:ScpA family protein [Jonesia quinghaiensis]